MENKLKLPLIKTTENLETERLIFRKITVDDINLLMPFFSSAEAMKFLPALQTPEQTAVNWVARQLTRYEETKSGLYILEEKSTGKIIGQCGLLVQEVDNITELEIGYHLLPEHWKKGFATEAATACKTFAFNNNLADSLISIIDIGNINSQKVAMRNGMQVEKQTTFKGLSVYIYRIHKAQYFSSKT